MKNRYINNPEEMLNLIASISQELTPEIYTKEFELFLELKKIINSKLEDLLSKDAPEDVTSIFYHFNYELNRFEEFLSFPDFSTKNVIGIGGKFSSGKSSFVNALLTDRILPTGTTPTTSIPTLIGKSDKEEIAILNIFNRLIRIDREALKVLKHFPFKNINYSFSHLLKHIFVKTEKLKYSNIVLLDTPGVMSAHEGYSELTDENRAIAELNNSSFVIWCISADQGTITEDEINILNKIEKRIEKIIILTKADKIPPEDVERVLSHIKEVVSNKGLNIIDVIPYSSKKKDKFPFDKIERYLSHWDKKERILSFGKNFKKFFVKIKDYYLKEEDEEKLKLNRLNRALSLAENDPVVNELTIITDNVKVRLKALKEKREKIENLMNDFFIKLKEIADLKSIPIPNPDELELIDIESDLTKELINYINKNRIRKRDYQNYLNVFLSMKSNFFKKKEYKLYFEIKENNFLELPDYLSQLNNEFQQPVLQKFLKFSDKLKLIKNLKFDRINFLTFPNYLEILLKEFL